MNRYNKGYKLEQKAKKFLEDKGFIVYRCAGSKGVGHVDLIAFSQTDIIPFEVTYIQHKYFTYMIQCKYGNSKMSKADQKEFMETCNKVNAIPLFCYQEKYKKMKFLNLDWDILEFKEK